MSVSFFSAPKPFLDPHITTIQRNAIRSWLGLDERIEVLLLGDDPGIHENAVELGASHLPEVERNEFGTPLISSIFDRAQSHAEHSIVAFINTDVMLMSDFMPAVEEIRSQQSQFLAVGQRWDLEQKEQLEFEAGWEQPFRNRLKEEGSLRAPAGSDYFIFPRGQFTDLPPFALGRAGWDNWMIFKARSLRIPVIDATGAITVVHQAHDYQHLKNGLPHYQSEERYINVRLGGGPDTIFTLADATWRYNGQGLSRIPWPQGGLLRWVRSALVARAATRDRLRYLHAILHPVDFARSRIAQATSVSDPGV